MAPKSQFLLKDSPQEVLEAASDKVQPKGRTYHARYSHQPGGIDIADLITGMQLASVAITDDEPNTLRNVSKTNPWQEQALSMITGSVEEAHQPLSTILQQHFGLTLDTHINVSGIHHGRPLDTQGYIAHNDDTIVLSYRCTTSILDWITNFSTTSSEWEPDVDILLGHAGYCSCLQGHDWNFCGDNETESIKPRVHTGFYNNFLSTTALIQQHILPLLQADQLPRKLYVVGHSLGAGVATMAACYFLLNIEWELLPHQLVCVTAGSPRAVQRSMQQIVHQRLEELKPLGKATFCRIVLNEDLVTKVPPSFLGYVHLDSLVYITEEGEILIRPDEHAVLDNGKDVAAIVEQEDPYRGLSSDLDENDNKSDEKIDSAAHQPSKPNQTYKRMLRLVPGPLKDHMPDFYLQPLVRLFEHEQKRLRSTKRSEKEICPP